MRSLKHALVVGGAGFVGSWLVDVLAADGVEVTVVDTPDRSLRNEVAGEVVLGDIVELDVAALVEEREIDIIFQLAGTGLVPLSLDRPLDDLRRNVATTVAVLEGARRATHGPRVVYVSSAAVYGEGRRMPMDESHPLEPISPYGVSKLAGEQYLKLYADQFGVECVSVRPFSIYGPRQRKLVVYDLMSRLLDGEDPLVVRAVPEISRDLVYVEDAARALVTIAAAAPAHGEAYNLAAGTPTPLAELASAILSALDLDTAVDFTGTLRPGDPLHWHGDARRAQALGVRLETTLAEGLRSTAQWIARERERDARAVR